MKMARIFLLPAGDMWFDIPLRPDQNCQTVFQYMRGEGAIIHPEFIIPSGSVHHVRVIVAPDPPTDAVPSYLIPTTEGKPN